MPKFETKNFFEMLSFTENSGLCRGVWASTFLVTLNLRSKNFFEIFSFAEQCECGIFFGGEGVQAPSLFGHAKFGVKNFSEVLRLQSTLDSEIFRGWFGQLFLVMPNLSPKMFGDFFVYRVLCTLNFLQGVSRHQLFLVILNLRSKILWNFFIYRVLWTMNFSEGVSGHQLFLVMLNLRSKNFQNFSYLHSTLD